MPTRIRTVLTVAVAAMSLSTAAASANRLSVDDQDFRMTYPEFRMAASFGEVSCAVTLVGSYHAATFAKTRGSLIGFLTSATVGSCTGGRMSFLAASLPWHVTYQSFTGTLPNIVRVIHSYLGLSAQAEVLGVTCLARTTTTEPAAGVLDFSMGRLILEIVAAERVDTVDVGAGTSCDSFGVTAEFNALTFTVDDGAGGSLLIRLI